MKRLRIFLLMFSLGLASVNFFNFAYEKLTEVPMKLPETRSEYPITVFPRNEKEIPYEVSTGCKRREVFPAERISRKKSRNRK
jgi:hypothetical protein